MDKGYNEQFEYINKIKQINLLRVQNTGHRLKAKLEWFGCQMNQRDTETLCGIISDMGYEFTEDFNEADLVIFNTCSVRENAENKMYGNLGELKNLKLKKNPNLIIGICGCMTQRKGAAEEITKSYPYVDIIMGTHNLYTFPKTLFNVMQTKKHIVDIWDIDGEVIEDLPVKREGDLKAWVNITYGCNNFCTYCIVPYVRGRERSRNASDIIREVKELAKEGFKEITFLGQNVNSYGKGLDEKTSFSDLLKMAEKVEGIERIRFMTPHPKDLSDELIDTIANSEKICSHIHLPLQSGSSRILKAMNRHYTKEQYLNLVKKIKTKIPDVAITTDIIVGFPGETEEDFLDTMDVVRQVEYDQAYTFIYSKRPGTPASEMENQVDEKDKSERIQRLIELHNELCHKNNKALEGKTLEVLVEGLSKSDENVLTGRTKTNKIVNFKGPKELIGNTADVYIVQGEKFWLKGELREC